MAQVTNRILRLLGWQQAAPAAAPAAPSLPTAARLQGLQDTYQPAGALPAAPATGGAAPQNLRLLSYRDQIARDTWTPSAAAAAQAAPSVAQAIAQPTQAVPSVAQPAALAPQDLTLPGQPPMRPLAQAAQPAPAIAAVATAAPAIVPAAPAAPVPAAYQPQSAAAQVVAPIQNAATTDAAYQAALREIEKAMTAHHAVPAVVPIAAPSAPPAPPAIRMPWESGPAPSPAPALPAIPMPWEANQAPAPQPTGPVIRMPWEPAPQAPQPQPLDPQSRQQLETLSPQELARLGREDKAGFFAALRPAAEEAERQYGVPAAVTLAQAALETGWGQHIIPGYNIFGIKGKGPAGTTEQGTSEVYGGKTVHISANFAKYHNFYEGVVEHGKLFHNGYYGKAMDQFQRDHDPIAFGRNLTGVYATDPEYGDKLASIMRGYHLV
jgi:flagellum-specific peptidoglycan hydrolase FlgJ